MGLIGVPGWVGSIVSPTDFYSHQLGLSSSISPFHNSIPGRRVSYVLHLCQKYYLIREKDVESNALLHDNALDQLMIDTQLMDVFSLSGNPRLGRRQGGSG